VQITESGEISTSTEAMPGKYWDEFYYYSGEERRRINPRKHIGGGYTNELDQDSVGYTFRFWISGNARKDSALFSKEAGNTCGPIAGATQSSK